MSTYFEPRKLLLVQGFTDGFVLRGTSIPVAMKIDDQYVVLAPRSADALIGTPESKTYDTADKALARAEQVWSAQITALKEGKSLALKDSAQLTLG